MEADTRTDAEVGAEKLKREAVALLNRGFNFPDGMVNAATERIVDCIVGAAILELTSLLSKAAKGE